jgi:hypothetical protein
MSTRSCKTAIARTGIKTVCSGGSVVKLREKKNHKRRLSYRVYTSRIYIYKCIRVYKSACKHRSSVDGVWFEGGVLREKES